MHEGHRLRLKQRFLSEGLNSFEDHEVLELILYYTIPQGDTNPLAHRLIERFHTLSGVFNADEKDLLEVEGIGSHSATLIKLIPQLSQLYASLAMRSRSKILSTSDAGEYVCSRIGMLSNEVFALVCLDAQRQILAFEIIDEGTVSQANVHPRKVLECALRHNCSAVILAHNHPSGSLIASENDRLFTKKLCSVFDAVGIEVADHIIAANSAQYTSMRDEGIITK